MRFIRKAGAPAEKSPKRLHVEPAELARKLVKEMDDHTVSRGDRVWVRNRYTIYLCPEDHEKLAPRAAQINADLAGKLARHVREMGYLLQGELEVEMVMDPELELGYFGILAQRVYPQRPAEEALAAAPPPAVPVPGAAARAQADPVPSAPIVAAASSGMAEAAVSPQQAPADPNIPPSTELLAAKQAEELGLARRIIVITSGDEVREFSQGRVVLGRSKEADLRIDDPNVSRKHAAIYWRDGRLVLEDLQSTNGTLVNGYPITSTVLRPRDVVAIGDSRLTIESK